MSTEMKDKRNNKPKLPDKRKARMSGIGQTIIYCKNSLSYFRAPLPHPMCVTHMLMGVGPFSGTWQTYGGATPFPKTDCPSCICHQLSIGPQLGVRACELFPLPAEMLTGLILYKSCTGNHRCCEFMNVAILSCPEDTILPDF